MPSNETYDSYSSSFVAKTAKLSYGSYVAVLNLFIFWYKSTVKCTPSPFDYFLQPAIPVCLEVLMDYKSLLPILTITKKYSFS